MRQRFVRQVASRYPETEGHLPEDLRDGCIPPLVEAAIREAMRPVPGEKASAVKHKHATPVDAARTTALALADLRPSSGFPDRNSHNMAPQDAQQLIALRKQYFLTASTDVDMLPQWNTNFFAQAFPFSIPRVVGGADFPWKPRPRRAEHAPLLDPQSWTRMLATRVEASVRNDWLVVPCARNLATKHKALCGNDLACKHTVDPNKAGVEVAAELTTAAASLYQKLVSGYWSDGRKRRKINHDVSKLQYALELSATERRAAALQ